MNLADLFPITQELPIKFPDGTDTGIVVKLVSTDSKQFHSVISRQAQAAMGREKELSFPERERAAAEQIAACIVGWTGIDDTPYSPEKAIELILTPELTFLREAIEGYAVKRANFFHRGPEKTGAVHSAVGPIGGKELNGSIPKGNPRRVPKAIQEAGKEH